MVARESTLTDRRDYECRYANHQDYDAYNAVFDDLQNPSHTKIC